jgi:hypothetical protein
LTGIVSDGDVLDFQWFQLYSVDSGNMRLSFAFLDAGNNALLSRDYNVSGQSPGWSGSVSNSPFERQLQRLAVPTGTTQLRVNFASGGASSVTGTMVIDDLSIQVGKLVITGVTHDVSGVTLTWDSSPTATYTVLSATALGPTATWTSLVTGWGSGGVTTSYVDTTTYSSNQVFYRGKQE